MPAKAAVKEPKVKNTEPKVLSPETLARRARNKVKSSEARAARHDRGLPVTMPRITWEWATATINPKPNTRKVRSVDAYMAQVKGGRQSEESPSLGIETNPEAKSKSPQKKNGR